MRQIKDAKSNVSGDLIYFKSHAKATYMSDGSTVEDFINYLITRIETLENELFGPDMTAYVENNSLNITGTGVSIEENNTLKLISGNVDNNKLIL